MKQSNTISKKISAGNGLLDPLFFPILDSHIKRLGSLRVLLGAIGMYLTIPIFMLIYVSVVAMIMRGVVFPILNIKSLKDKNHIILDRYKVKGLSLFDKFHCLFCGLANGLCTLLNDSSDILIKTKHKINLLQKTLLFIVAAIYTVPCLVLQTVLHYIFNYIIALPLGLKKASYRAATAEYKKNHKDQPMSLGRFYLGYQKVTWMVLTQALSQIESSFCPIKHFEKMESVVYPNHHKIFFEPHQINELRQHLLDHGSVLKKK